LILHAFQDASSAICTGFGRGRTAAGVPWPVRKFLPSEGRSAAIPLNTRPTMTTALPSILILAETSSELGRIMALVGSAGLLPLPAADPATARALLCRGGCDGAIIALDDQATRAFATEARGTLPHVLAVLDDDAAPIDDPCVIAVRRPLEQRELLEAILTLALGGDGASAPAEPGLYPASAAEFGLGAARLACIAMREAETAASGRA